MGRASQTSIKFGNVTLVVDTAPRCRTPKRDDSTLCPVENMHVAAVASELGGRRLNFPRSKVEGNKATGAGEQLKAAANAKRRPSPLGRRRKRKKTVLCTPTSARRGEQR